MAAGVRRAEARPGEAAEGARGGEHQTAEGGRGPDLGEADPQGGRVGKLVSPARRRTCVEHVVAELGVSEWRACRVLGQHRSSQRRVARSPDDEAALTGGIVELAQRYGRYGYRRITALLRHAGWPVSRVQRSAFLPSLIHCSALPRPL
jgi:hypothetical protein